MSPPTPLSLAGEGGRVIKQCRLRVKNGYGGRSTGTSAVPQIADDFGAPRKSAELGQSTKSLPKSGGLAARLRLGVAQDESRIAGRNGMSRLLKRGPQLSIIIIPESYSTPS